MPETNAGSPLRQVACRVSLRDLPPDFNTLARPLRDVRVTTRQPGRASRGHRDPLQTARHRLEDWDRRLERALIALLADEFAGREARPLVYRRTATVNTALLEEARSAKVADCEIVHAIGVAPDTWESASIKEPEKGTTRSGAPVPR
ncbi:MAG: hypothetical protein JXQ29_01730 [Planctomycetes bacterium]|nr:hypothetical protein [Planctomycetota bacterium]